MTAIFQRGANGVERVVPSTPKIRDFLIGTQLETNPAWLAWCDALDNVETTGADANILALQQVRSITPDSPQSTVRQACSMLGFDLDSDVFQLSQNAILNVVNDLGSYTSTLGTPDFVKFFDFVMNSNSKVNYLWTNDYKNFYPAPKGLLITEGGTWYNTTHVSLEIELYAPQSVIDSVFTSAAGATIGTIEDKIKEVFYQFAPLTLVLDSVFLRNSLPINLNFAAQLLDYRRDELVVR